MQRAMLGFLLLYIFEGKNLKCGLLFYLFIIFQKKCEINYTLNLFFIDNEKGIPHF